MRICESRSAIRRVPFNSLNIPKQWNPPCVGETCLSYTSIYASRSVKNLYHVEKLGCPAPDSPDQVHGRKRLRVRADMVVGWKQARIRVEPRLGRQQWGQSKWHR